MKKIICLLLFIFSVPLFAQTTAPLSYTIKPIDEHTLSVELSFTGSSSGETTLTLPNEWGGRKNFFKHIKNLTVTGESSPTISNDALPYKKHAHHAPNEKLTLSYQVEQSFPGKPMKPFDFFEAIIQKEYAHFLGRNVLIIPVLDTPVAADGTRDIVADFQWDIPKYWKVANSFSVQQRIQKQISTTEKGLLDAIFMLGAIQLTHDTLNKTDLWFAVIGTYPKLDLKQLFTNAKKTFAYHMSFWDDSRPFFIFGIVPSGEGDSYYTGTRPTNAFLLELPAGVQLDTGPGLSWITAHELFHIWNEPELLNIKNVASEPEVYWLSEGFTDYYATLNMLRAGVYTLSDYINSYNEVILAYYDSPYRSFTNKEVGEHFWDDYYGFVQVAFYRGEILAHNWNVRIKEASKNKYSFDDFMKHIYPQDTKKRMSIREVIDMSKTYLPGGIGKDLDMYVEKGALIKPNPKSLGPCVSLIMEKKSMYKTSFPVQYHLNTGLVSQVKKGSHAEKAGLKKGDIIVHIDRKKNKLDYPVTVTIKDSDKEKQIKYMPDEAPLIDVPQFKLNQEMMNSNPKACLDWFKPPH